MPRKKAFILGLLVSLILASLLGQSAMAANAMLPTETDQRLRIDGTEEMAAINKLLKQRYEKQFPDAAVELKTSGTQPALERLLNDQIDLAAIGRTLTPAETAAGLREIPISREKIAILVGEENPFKGDLTVEQLRQIFRGEISDWAELGGAPGAIRVIDRPEDSDTRFVLQQYAIFRDLEFAGEQFVRLPHDDTTDLLNELGSNGIGYAIASQLADQDKARIVKLVVTLNVLPDDPLYPYEQVRGYAYKVDPASAAQAFLGFVATKPGQAAVAAAKLSEANAVATGESIVAPVVPPAVAIDGSEAPVEPVSDWRQYGWLLLPLILLGLLLRWLFKRFQPNAPEPAVGERDTASKTAAAIDWDEAAELVTPDAATAVEPTAATASETASELIETEKIADSDAVIPAEPTFIAAEPSVSELSTSEPSTSEPSISEPAVDAFENTDADAFENPFGDIEDVFEDSQEESDIPLVIDGELVTETELIYSETIRAELVDRNPPPISQPEPAAEEVVTDTVIDGESSSELAAQPSVPAEATEDPVEISPILPKATAPTVILDIINIATGANVPDDAEAGQSSPKAAALKQAFLDRLHRDDKTLNTPLECYMALSALLCEQLLSLNTPERYLTTDARIVGEISAEYLPGPHLENSLINLGILSDAKQAMQELGLDLQQLFAQEEEPGLGKGGLGRLMVCYLDSLSTANVPAIGYGIRYEYGIFDQEIQDGWQLEVTDTWLRNGNPWEVERSDQAVQVKFGGYTEAYLDEQGRYRVRWLAAEVISGIPYDTPIPGYGSETVNLLRLWRADSNNLCQVLYPVDMELQGKELRLKQQFFLVSCAIQDALRLHLAAGGQPQTLPDRFALQLNDTDPTLAVAELMRLLVDENHIAWEQAWEITQRTVTYTNHSLMPETLDDPWTVGILSYFLPRHLEIIYEINYRLLAAVKAKYPGDLARLNRMSLIDERGERYIRLNYLACVGSHAVNGVSVLHTRLLEQTILRDFYEMYPDKFSNKTNGVTPRRFLLQGNPTLAALITQKIGDGWITDLAELKGLAFFATDSDFQQQWRQIKQAAKQKLAAQIQQQTGVVVDPGSLFDVQAMVVHEYKRQYLNVLHILTLYNRLKANPKQAITPRTFIFAGKAAADYFTAKLIIKLINNVAQLINCDPDVNGRLKVVFLKDFNIKSAQPIYPAIDLAEHISVAGTEAGDTGNMIAAMNGALIIGTPDGTNLEIRQAIGAENFFQFGLTVEQVLEWRAQGYSPLEIYNANHELKAAIDRLTSGELANRDTELFKPLVNLLYHDQYMLLADYSAYVACQERVSQAYQNPDRWTRMSVLTVANSGQFSSDRAIRDYCSIWQITPSRLSTLK